MNCDWKQQKIITRRNKVIRNKSLSESRRSFVSDMIFTYGGDMWYIMQKFIQNLLLYVTGLGQ